MKKTLITAAAVLIFSAALRAALLVDDCETGTLVNSLGGAWQALNDGYSSITFTPNASPAYAGNYCRQMDWFYGAGNPNGPYAQAQTPLNNSWGYVNLSAYYGVRFYAKGTAAYDAELPIQGTSTTYNHYSKLFVPTASWQLYELPFFRFAQTWGTPVPWDPTTIYAVVFQPLSSAGFGGTLQIDNLEFYTQAEAQTTPTDPNVILPQPKVNQEGYLQGEKKYFCVVTNTASTGTPYYVLDAGNNTVFTGTITGTPVDDRQTTGEGVWKVDFSAFDTPGQYIVTVNGLASCPFKIAGNVYDSLFKDALRCFYLIRCGIAENDPISGVNRPACHTADATIRGGTVTGDFTGGWHNADDFGKYINETAISVAYMLWLYELKGGHMSGLQNNIPETGNGLSDLLNEAKWGLDWMLKMQRPDGTVLHKVDSEPNLFDCIAPDADTSARYAEYQAATNPQAPSTIDAADFAASMAQAGRVFGTIDPAYSEKCLAAARKAWSWAQANTKTAQTDPYYTDPAQWQEFMWAQAEMARANNDQNLRNSFSAGTDVNALGAAGWGDPQIFGYLTLYEDPNSPAALKAKLSQKVNTLCQGIISNIQNSGYMADLQPAEYYWESNETLMHRACALLFNYAMSGDTTQKDAALMQLNYMLGLNSLNKSFIMSHGCNPMTQPWNCIYLYYNKSLPGWCAGGPNQYTTGADQLLINVITSGAPKAKCYVDAGVCNVGSWADNEGETSENAALVFLSGYFYSVVYPVPTPVPAPAGTPAPNLDNIKAAPAPCDMRAGCTGIMFTNLTGHTILRIYNLKGELVYGIEADTPDGKILWPLMQKKKDEIMAAGFYVYSIGDGKGHVKTGKVAVIR